MRSQSGVATSDVVVSAHVGGNADVFPAVLSLHVPEGSVVADVTFGRGVFWRNVPPETYRILPTDISTGIDCRSLPYDDASVDAVVLDPPYMEGFYRQQGRLAGSGTHAAFLSRYSSGVAATAPAKGHDAVISVYVDAGREAARVVRSGGCLIVKCQDAVSANRQRLTHIELINAYAAMGWTAVDLFVVVRTNRPSVSRLVRQRHARKNHSYFLVFYRQKKA